MTPVGRAKCPNGIRSCRGFEGGRNARNVSRCHDCLQRWEADWLPQPGSQPSRAPQPQRNGVDRATFEAQKAAALEREAARREERRTARQAHRRFPADNAEVNGRPAHARQEGSRIEAYWGRDHEAKVVTNDGLNASYVRDDDGTIHVDERSQDPYTPHNRDDH